MRFVLVCCLAACGDNAADCGYTTMMTYQRNIWAPQLAVDDANVYYADYDNDGYGTKVIWRRPTSSPREYAIATRTLDIGLGLGMTISDGVVYWTAETDPVGYALLATPALGGPTDQLAALGDCMPQAVSVDVGTAYVGSIRCNALPSQVIAVRDRTTTMIWSSNAADVEDVKATSAGVFVATTGGLVLVTSASTDLVDGHPTHRLQLTGDEIVYSTDEGVWARALAGVTPRRLYDFSTPIENIRAFAVDDVGLYVSEPPQIQFVPHATAQPVEIVADAGLGVEHIEAAGGYAYWSALVWPGYQIQPDSFSGGVARVSRPCQ